MPWIRKGKCVYKKNKDGSKGEKEGCSSSDEKAEKYLKNLYRIEGEKTKKENKTMKMKKSELIALIKEEIMSEMDGLTMMDDPYDDPRLDAEHPEIGEANKIVEMVMEMASGDNALAMEMLQNAISFIQGAMDVEAEPMMEKAEKLNEAMDWGSFMQVVGAIKQMMPMIAAMGAPVAIGLFYEALKKQIGTPERDGGEM